MVMGSAKAWTGGNVGISKPYRRTVRQLADGSYANGGNARYIRDPLFASDAEHYVRAFMLIQKDLLALFDYVEPSDVNLPTYSYRIHELLTRTCIEVEANFKAILTENGCAQAYDMRDYVKCEASHFLSQYELRFPVWQGTGHTTRPFLPWASAAPLPWYQAYNHAKHSRHGNFQEANFGNLLDAFSGLVALLSAQFWTEDFSPAPDVLSLESRKSDMECAIGGYLEVKFPTNFPATERYDFDWRILGQEGDRFQPYPYP